MFFSHVCVCVCVFLFFDISVDFRVPLADAKGQIRSVLDRFCCHFWINFPALSAARAELLQRLRKKLLKELAENLQRTIKKPTRNAKNLQRTSNKLPKSEISCGVFHSSTRQQPQQTSRYKRGGGGTRACALGLDKPLTRRRSYFVSWRCSQKVFANIVYIVFIMKDDRTYYETWLYIVYIKFEINVRAYRMCTSNLANTFTTLLTNAFTKHDRSCAGLRCHASVLKVFVMVFVKGVRKGWSYYILYQNIQYIIYGISNLFVYIDIYIYICTAAAHGWSLHTII